ncbi:MAG: hypothetical protein JWR48_6567 [Mycobacterium sp.]|jgi:hypothetical protein|nr:hypothetical protein [Mycobacterium sp.]
MQSFGGAWKLPNSITAASAASWSAPRRVSFMWRIRHHPPSRTRIRHAELDHHGSGCGGTTTTSTKNGGGGSGGGKLRGFSSSNPVADDDASTCMFAEFSSKWRTRFSNLRGGSENQTVVQDSPWRSACPPAGPRHGQRGIADRQAVRVADYRGYGMSVRECLCHQLFADSAGRTEYGDVHLVARFPKSSAIAGSRR